MPNEDIGPLVLQHPEAAVAVGVICAETDAEAQVIKFISTYVKKGVAPLCGNSISQDRRFLERYMPLLDGYLHYRNIDVSTLKELAKRWRPDVYSAFKKKQRHTALADVHESIDEMRHYHDHFLNLALAVSA